MVERVLVFVRLLTPSSRHKKGYPRDTGVSNRTLIDSQGPLMGGRGGGLPGPSGLHVPELHF